jgi:hypothetical protein
MWRLLFIAFAIGLLALLVDSIAESHQWVVAEWTATIIGAASIVTIWALFGTEMLRLLIASGVFSPESRRSGAFKVLVASVALFVICAALRARPNAAANHSLTGPAGLLQIFSFLVSIFALVSLPRVRP